MNKKHEGDRAIEQRVNKLTVAKCMDCTCFSLRKTTRAITQLYDEALRPTGLRVTQFSLLIATVMLESVTVTRLAEIGVMDRTTLTRNLCYARISNCDTSGRDRSNGPNHIDTQS